MPPKSKSKTLSNETPRYLLLGEILRPHGIRGELRMRVLTDYPERISKRGYIFLGKDPNTDKAIRYTVEAMRMHHDYGLLKLAGVDDRTAAEAYRELFVMIPLEDAVPLEEGEVYLFQLIGLTVQTSAGEILGKLTEVLETGANDVYFVDSPKYGDVLIPATDDTIVEVNVEAGTITVELPEGLLPES